MPLPLIVPVAIGVAGLWGTYKAGKAVKDNMDAKDINNDAMALVEEYQKRVEQQRELCNNDLAYLGQKKFDALTKTLNHFVTSYGKLKNVDLATDTDMAGLNIKNFDDRSLEEMKHDITLLQNSALGLGAGAVGGAMTAFGAYSGTMLLASAGTGTAIATLSGAAAKSATLAWLGGGTLASGGLGVAGGTAVLGVMIAGPALAILGGILGAKAEESLNYAKSNQEEAKKFRADAETILSKLQGIAKVAMLAAKTLSDLKPLSRRASAEIEKIIAEKGTDFSQFSDAEKASVFKAVKFAQLLKALIDTAIIDKEGNILADTEANIQNIAECS